MDHSPPTTQRLSCYSGILPPQVPLLSFLFFVPTPRAFNPLAWDLSWHLSAGVGLAPQVTQLVPSH